MEGGSFTVLRIDEKKYINGNGISNGRENCGIFVGPKFSDAENVADLSAGNKWSYSNEDELVSVGTFP